MLRGGGKSGHARRDLLIPLTAIAVAATAGGQEDVPDPSIALFAPLGATIPHEGGWGGRLRPWSRARRQSLHRSGWG